MQSLDPQTHTSMVRWGFPYVPTELQASLFMSEGLWQNPYDGEILGLHDLTLPDLNYIQQFLKDHMYPHRHEYRELVTLAKALKSSQPPCN